MKTLNRSLLIAAAIASLIACKKDKDDVLEPGTPTPGTPAMQMVGSAEVDGYTVEVYGSSANLRVGYNTLYSRVKDGGGNYLSGAGLDWEPRMTMMMGGMAHTHGSPHGTPAATAGDGTWYEGYVVFIMASSDMDHWHLVVSFSDAGQDHEAEVPLEVISTESAFHKVYTSAMGTDGESYMLALVEPTNPEAGVNDLVVCLFKHEAEDDFPMVNGFTLRVDPRMPGMGNHGAPGSEDLVQGADGFYHGAAGFSMSGYWKINLVLENANGEAVAGNEVTGSVLESSVHFKLEI